MERFFSPPATAIPEAERVWVLAPHADDEVFGCGGLLALLAQRGAQIRVLVMTQPEDAALAAQRQAESRQAAHLLGYPEPTFVENEDGGLVWLPVLTLNQQLRDWLARQAPDWLPDLVLAPSPWEMHRDHRRLCEATILLCREGPLAAKARLGFYEVGQPLTPNLLVDISAVVTRKAEAMAVFVSQQSQQNYRRQLGALNIYRTYSLPEEADAAEAFLFVGCDELGSFQQHLSPERLSTVVWQAEREVEAFRAEQVRLVQTEQSLRDELARLQTKLLGDLKTVQHEARELFARRLQVEQRLEETQSALGQAQSEREQLQSALALAQAKARQLDADKQALLGSLSWRVTAPLRDLARVVREPVRIRLWLMRQPRALLQRLQRQLHGLRRWAQGLPVQIRRHPTRLYHWLERQTQLWVVSTGELSGHQAMLERRLGGAALPASGWRAVCEGPLDSGTDTLHSWPGVTISVVTFNSGRWLPGLLNSLLAQHYPLARLSLHLVDNGSQDDTLAQLDAFRAEYEAAFARVTLSQLPNPGFGAAHNHAIAQAEDDWVLITNPDLELGAETLPRVVRMALADGDEVASWELRQAPYEHPKHYDPVSWETLWSSHACLLVRRSVFQALGGYDERIFLYGEDVEFSFRCREAGYLLRYCPLAQVLHHTYAEPNELKPAQYVGSTRANLFLRLRYGSARDASASLLLAGASLLRGPFPGARRRLLAAYGSLLWQTPRLLWQNRAGRVRGVGVFRGLDYEMIRAGAFEPAPTLPVADACPLVSVITRTYQGRDWLLRQAGLSVLQQTWPNLEWIVVEDGGEHCRATVDALAALAPMPVRYLSQPKQGRSRAGNLGLEAARGRWCLFLDDDDLLYADHVEALAARLLAEPGLAAAYALAWDVIGDVDPSTRTIQEHAYVQHAAHVQPFDRDELAWRNYIPIQAILFERRLYLERGGFREHFDQLEDWNLWRRYAQGERFELVQKTTSLYRTPAHVEHSGRRQILLDEAYEQVKRETDAELKSIANHAA
ncbi:glycosyltransferase [Halochromatium roseum]|uniref:glycosyltransferase n=1 Tax=Halochromatium roseum TaxID=391920 RepID=UPI00191136AE|nr:glycosyltransferase [Halochromatium roseum]MBK5937913.1 hypothetical protein [Halochromatium roseum]